MGHKNISIQTNLLYVRTLDQFIDYCNDAPKVMNEECTR